MIRTLSILLLCINGFATDQLINHVAYTRVVQDIECVEFNAFEVDEGVQYKTGPVSSDVETLSLVFSHSDLTYAGPLSASDPPLQFFPGASYHLFGRPPPAV